jgi:deoxyadenosine/deoxycytidine kinase
VLQLFYDDSARWAYTFQHTTLMTRIANTHAALAAHPGEDVVLVSERSILTDRHVFAEMLQASGQLSELEWDLYNRWYAMLAGKMHVDGIVFVDTVPDVCAERIVKRNRVGETVPAEYLRDLDAAHRKWVATTPTPVLTLAAALTNDRPAVVAEIRAFVARLKDMQAARRAGDAAPATPVVATPDASEALPAVKTPSKARLAAHDSARPAGSSPLAAVVVPSSSE